MDVGRKRAGVKTSVAAGSVWESRMKLDEVKGGIKVFNGEANPEETGEDGASTTTTDTPRKLVKKGRTGTSSVLASGKRKTWKSESLDGPIQIAKGTTCDQKDREFSFSADGIKKSPIQARKGRSEGARELNMSVDGIDKSPNQVKKGRSEGSGQLNMSADGNVKSPIQVKKGRSDANKEVDVSVDGNEKSPIQTRRLRSDIKEVVESDGQLRKVKSNPNNVAIDAGKDAAVHNGIERSLGQLCKEKLEPDKVLDESIKDSDESISVIQKSPPEIETGPEESCEEFGVCQEKVISSSSESNAAIFKSPGKLFMDNDDDGDDVVIDGDEEFEEDEEEEKMDEEVETKSFDIKEISIPEEKPRRVETDVPEQKPKRVETDVPEQKPKRVEANVLEQKPKKEEFSLSEQKPTKVMNAERKVHHFSNMRSPTSPTVNKQPPPVLRRAMIYQNLTKTAPIPAAAEYRQSFPETHNKLQNLVDLVMWRDISRSAFVFGIGTFIIISSSYMKDLNVSFISVISYLGLVYLAAIFLYRSLICRGIIDLDDNGSYVVGEDEATWLLKLVLPYLNECLLKIRALFSGDPATTMKMAVLLFVFARCGSSITIWKMSKLGFFGVFIVPKVCSSYSTQLTAYGKFWIRRFRDAWDSCSHKKAVALAIFTLVWNLSSIVARIWAVFMMFVAVRYYQQTMERDDWVGEEEDDDDDGGPDKTWDQRSGGQRQANGPSSTVEATKVKRRS